jgi:hypothetical protein
MTLNLADEACVSIFITEMTFEFDVISIARLRRTTRRLNRFSCLRLSFFFDQNAILNDFV